MNKATIIEYLRKSYKATVKPVSPNTMAASNIATATDAIKDMLTSGNSCMISRLGYNELQAILFYLDEAKYSKWSLIKKYIRNETAFYNWHTISKWMASGAGFFPADEVNLRQFAEMYLEDLKYIDILGSWLPGEKQLAAFLEKTETVDLKYLEPYYNTDHPWSQVLEGKKVLVIHPFEATIKAQYEKRAHLFENKNILPQFHLITYKAVQSISGNGYSTGFTSWFHALEKMKGDISAIDFDIAIIGCGAYGLPLAAHIKRSGKKAVHLGGATQILFGIKGRRWMNLPFFQSLFNEHWITPLQQDVPPGFEKVENGCYW